MRDKMEERVLRYRSVSGRAKDALHRLLNRLNEGRAPTGEELEDCHGQLQSLLSCYDEIRTEILTLPDLPDSLSGPCPVDSYWDFYQSSSARALAEERDKAEVLLRDFLRMGSADRKYDVELEPCRERARRTLEELESVASAEELEGRVSFARLFQQAVEVDTVYAPGNEELLTRLDQEFLPGVIGGLALKKYHKLSAAPAAREVEAPAPEEPSGPEPLSERQDPSPAGEAPVPEEVEELPFGDSPQEEEIGRLQPLSERRPRNVNVNNFKKDMGKLPGGSLFLFPYLSAFGGLVSPSLMAGYAKCFGLERYSAWEDLQSTERSLESLSAKGYLEKLFLPGREQVIYGASKYAADCVQKKTIYDDLHHKIRVPFGRNLHAVDWEQVTSRTAEQRLDRTGAYLALVHAVSRQGWDLGLGISAGELGFGISTGELWDSLIQAKEDGDVRYRLVPCRAGDSTEALQGPCLFVPLDDDVEGLKAVLRRREEDTLLLVDDVLLDRDYEEGDWVPLLPEKRPKAELPAEDGPQEEAAPKEVPFSKETDGDPEPAEPAPPVEDAPPRPTAAERTPEPRKVQTTNAQSMAEDMLREDMEPQGNEAAFEALIRALLADGGGMRTESLVKNPMAEALVLSKALALTGLPRCQLLYQQLLMATDSAIGSKNYTGNELVTLFSERNENSALHLAAALRALFAPQQEYDYDLINYAKDLFADYDRRFGPYLCVKPLFNLLQQGAAGSAAGYSAAVLEQFGDQRQREHNMALLRGRAETLLPEPVIRAMITGMPEMKANCFGPKSDLYMGVKAVFENNQSERELVCDLLDQYGDQNLVSPDKVNAFIDVQWHAATRNFKTRNMELEYKARNRVYTSIVDRLELMRDWLRLTDGKRRSKSEEDLLRQLRDQLLDAIQTCLPKLEGLEDPVDAAILGGMLELLRARLEGGGREDRYAFADLLRTGAFSLDENWLPLLDEEPRSVRFFEPWRNALRHVAQKVNSLQSVLAQISDRDSEIFDDLNRGDLIRSYLSEHGAEVPPGGDLHTEADALKAAQECCGRFQEELELNFTYGRIDEPMKETLWDTVLLYQPYFLGRRDYGRWRAFLNALRAQMEEKCRALEKGYRAELNRRRSAGNAADPALEHVEHILDQRNFAVAEEYLNRFDARNALGLEALTLQEDEEDTFARFVESVSYDEIYSFCVRHKGSNLRKFGVQYLEEHMPRDWTVRDRDSARKLVDVWPGSRGNVSAADIEVLLGREGQGRVAGLGLEVRKVEQKLAVLPGVSEPYEHFRVSVSPVRRNRSEYAHPIAGFGTLMRSPLDVIILYRWNNAKTLLDTVKNLQLGPRPSIVLLNCALDLQQRRQVAELFHTRSSGLNPFLMIDWVLFLFLALQPAPERLPALLKCTLPFTYYQPFFTGATPDEMFIGRKKELASILEGKSVIVYGGRQLGKTAILERARSLSNNPDRGEYAVYVDALTCDSEKKLTEAICEKLEEDSISVHACRSLKNLCDQLRDHMRAGRISSLLLLVDETDQFLSSIAGSRYAALQPLVDLRRSSRRSFKFVLAGTHNVCRARAMGDNSILGQLGTEATLCIKPLSPLDAQRLLARPLQYIGFHIDSRSHLELILTNTNYYPGILQFFGASLVEAMSNNYREYYRATAGNPPFPLQDKQLQAILASEEINKSIAEKLRMTLRLDPRYYMLARSIAWLYYFYAGPAGSSGERGYRAEEILETAESLNMAALSGVGPSEVVDLLREMTEMGILHEIGEGRFRLRRRAFLSIIGSSMEAIEDDAVKAGAAGEEES